MSTEFPLHKVIEAILFASQKPVSAKELASICKGAAEAAKETPEIAGFAKLQPEQIEEAIQALEAEINETGRAFEIRESAAGWQLVTRADYAPWLRQLFPENRPARLSAPALETLAIIAYRQPITRADIEAVRGVAVDGVMQTLLDRGLVRIAGRAEIAGRPLLYETTQFFMEHFGLKDLDDLPNAGELRRIPLPTAEPPAAEPASEAAVEPQPAEPAPAEPELIPAGESVNVSAEPADAAPAEPSGEEEVEPAGEETKS
ncbi:MAG: SMC-Scp complex subunit ScpB [Terrimicrobiaceae bacterium]|nr:SMC-Scp complex subunit ScpB [Terrimicrobiaceae bacterium]